MVVSREKKKNNSDGIFFYLTLNLEDKTVFANHG
jgi:hypothetical protein